MQTFSGGDARADQLMAGGTMHFGPAADYAPSLNVDFSVTVLPGTSNPLLQSAQLPKSTAELGFLAPPGNSGTPDQLKWTHRSRQLFDEFKLCPLPSLQLVGAAP